MTKNPWIRYPLGRQNEGERKQKKPSDPLGCETRGDGFFVQTGPRNNLQILIYSAGFTSTFIGVKDSFFPHLGHLPS